MHPHHFSLSLLKDLIERVPKVFPVEKRTEMLKAYDVMVANPAISAKEIEDATIKIGKEIWPYRMAFQEIYKTFGKQKEEDLVREGLPPDLLVKFVEFRRGGGSLDDFRHGAVLEETFTPEEKYILGQTLLKAYDEVVKEMEESCQRERKAEFDELVNEYKTKESKLIEKISALKGMAENSEKWRAEINEKALAFEEGFSLLDKNFSEEDIDGAIDYYRGVIEETEAL